jgi:hypothetical protein
LQLSCSSEPEPTEGKLQANSSSRISLLLSMSCVLYGQTTSKIYESVLADWRDDYKQVVQGDQGILDPFLFLQHQVMVISFLVPLSIIHSFVLLTRQLILARWFWTLQRRWQTLTNLDVNKM